MSNEALERIGSQALASRFAADDNDDFSSGIGSSAVLPKLTIRGKDFAIEFNGERQKLPERELDIVFVGVRKPVSHKFYLGGYESGDKGKAPDCHSNNGITPDPGVSAPQSKYCATCPRAVWGSKKDKVTGEGKGKECQDYKLVVVMPLLAFDLPDEQFRNFKPLILQIPAASMKNLATYSKKAKAVGVSLYGFGTRIRFGDTEYPSLEFAVSTGADGQPIKLTAAQENRVALLRESPEVIETVLVNQEAAVEPHASEQPVALPVVQSAPPSIPVPPVGQTFTTTSPAALEQVKQAVTAQPAAPPEPEPSPEPTPDGIMSQLSKWGIKK